MGVKCCLIASFVVVLALCATPGGLTVAIFSTHFQLFISDLPSEGSAVLDVDLFGQQSNIADIEDIRQKREAIPKGESGKMVMEASQVKAKTIENQAKMLEKISQ